MMSGSLRPFSEAVNGSLTDLKETKKTNGQKKNGLEMA